VKCECEMKDEVFFIPDRDHDCNYDYDLHIASD